MEKIKQDNLCKRIIEIILLAATFIVCLLFSMFFYGRKESAQTYNQARILLKSDIEQIQSAISNTGEIQVESLTYPAFIVGLDGIITSSDCEEYKIGQTLNLTKELQMDHAYLDANRGQIKVVFPINLNKKVAGFAVFFLDEQEVNGNALWNMFVCFLPLILWAVLALGIIAFYNIWVETKIFNPMEQMSDSSRAIIEGDFTRQIVQLRNQDKPQDQIQNLIYSFELMRDELKSRYEKELELKRQQKELMSCMSHDLRTPITTIQVHAEALKDGIVKTDEKKVEYLETIIRKSKVLNRMIADLLDHSNAQLN